MKNIKRRTVLSGIAGLAATAVLGNATAGEKDVKQVSIMKKPKLRGVVYDVGLNYAGNALSIEPFDTKLVELEIKTIAKHLHANAIRIEGEVIERLVVASRIAHKQGLAILFNPWKMNLNAVELKPFYVEAAKAAEKLRQEGIDIVFVTGCEYTIFQRGILPGETLNERLASVGTIFADGMEKAVEKMRPISSQVNKFLADFVVDIRKEFKGQVTYAALAFEQIDWSIFDIVGVDHYRSGETAEQYVQHFNSYRVNNKPVICMEVGCCTYEGAARLGGGGFMILDGISPDGSATFKGGVTPKRSEREQADYIETQVKLLADNNADGIFVFVFAFPSFPHGEGSKDLDLVSYSLVKTFPKDDPRSKKMPPWEPKESFHRLASLYAIMDSAQA